MDPSQAKAETKPLATPIRTAEPNKMHYTDVRGVEHNIYLPQGTMHTAYGHLQNKRWDELAKFEPYSKPFLPLSLWHDCPNVSAL